MTNNSVYTVSTNSVVVKSDRVFNQKNVDRLKKSILEVGLISPIFITEQSELVAGMHRLEAYKQLEEEIDGGDNKYYEIPAIVTKETDPAKLKIMEITENMSRNEKFTPVEMCKMNYEARQSWIEQGLFNDGHKQKAGENKLRNIDLANLLKVSESTIKNYLTVWKNVADELKEYLMDHREDYNLTDLLKLVKLDKAEQIEKAKQYTKEEMKKAKEESEKDDKDENEEEGQSNIDLVAILEATIHDLQKENAELKVKVIERDEAIKKLQDIINKQEAQKSKK